MGKYRIRVLEHPTKNKIYLDIREYVSAETFEGFTRRGITIESVTQANQLREILDLLVQEGLI